VDAAALRGRRVHQSGKPVVPFFGLHYVLVRCTLVGLLRFSASLVAHIEGRSLVQAVRPH